MFKPQVSVIVPIYNAGKYLGGLLASLQAQTFSNIEFICILDSPTDNSEEILRYHVSGDTRFKIVINTKNEHVGVTRNICLKCATGRYVGFVDADDYCFPSMYEELLEMAEKTQSDWVISKPTCTYDGINYLYHCIDEEITPLEIRRDLFGKGGFSFQMSRFGYIHNSIYRRDFLLEHNIHFVDTKLIMPEDSLFNMRVSMLTDNIVYYPRTLYVHIFRDDSMSSTKPQGTGFINFSNEKILRGVEILFDYWVSSDKALVDNLKTRVFKTILSLNQSINGDELESCAPKTKAFILRNKIGIFKAALKFPFVRDVYGNNLNVRIKLGLLRMYLHQVWRIILKF